VAVNWYFYSPLLESAGGPQGVCNSALSHSYLCFGDPNHNNKQLDIGTGFWVNKP
jgi:hypothetical protein